MSLRRLPDPENWRDWYCRHPEHEPPSMISLPRGRYEHKCPGCGIVVVFTAQGASL